MQHRQHLQHGQSLTEYGLGIGLVALISLAGLTSLGGNLKIALENMIPKPTPPVAVSVALPGGPAKGSGSSSSSQGPTQTGAPVSFSGNSVIKPADFTTNLTSTVTTLGANGTTFELAKQLNAMSAKMLASGEISETEANKLYALANQGYRLANLEKQVEDASKRNSSTGAFLASSINFDGKTYTMPQVASLIGFGTPTELRQDIKANNNYMLETNDASPETLAFINLYQDAINSPNLQNSEAKGVVSQLSSEISYLTDDVSNLIYGAYAPDITLENLNQNTVSAATVYDSTAICYVGNGHSGPSSCH